jgi:hypothetical protein
MQLGSWVEKGLVDGFDVNLAHQGKHAARIDRAIYANVRQWFG